MTVDGETTAGDSRVDAEPVSAGVSTATIVAYAVAGTAILAWFLFGWLVLQQGFVNSVGEAAGAAFALLLVVSIVGTVRRSRDR